MKEKKQVMVKGIGMHIGVYIALALILSLLKVPFYITVIVVMVLLWGLFVISYAYYYHN